MSLENEQDLKKNFIVDEQYYEKEKMPELIKSFSKFCKVGTGGKIYIGYSNLTTRERIKLVFVARLLANKLEKSIAAQMNVDEVVDSANVPREQVIARLSEFASEGFLSKINKGVYVATPFYIELFLEELNKKYKG